MFWIFAIAVIGLCLARSFSSNDNKTAQYYGNSNHYYDDDYTKADMEDFSLLKDGQEYYCNGNTIGFTPRKGYKYFTIKGMGFRLLSLTDIGRFEGYAEAEEDNPKDIYAVAIYREDHEHLGYIPKGNKRLYNYIKDQGGYVHCMGYVATYQDGTFYGMVAVEDNHTLVNKRNNPYEAEKYYDYKEGELKEFLDAMQSNDDNCPKADMKDISLLQEGQEYFCNGNTIGLSSRKGYTSFTIKDLGINLLSLTDIGRFEGYAMIEENKQNEKYAVAIYREDDEHLGYIHKSNVKVYKYIKNQGGHVHCIGYIATYQDGTFYGKVAVETDKTLILKRNTPYNTKKYYNYTDGKLKEFLETVQS